MSAFALTEASTQLRKPPNPNAIRMNSRSTSGECADVQCLPPRGYHTSESAINRPRMLSGSGHNGFDHTGETQGSYRQREDFFQDRKRCKVDNKQLVSDNRDNEMQASSHPNEGILHNRTRYEVIDSRFIAAHPHQPDYSSIRDINTGRNNCDPENSLQRNHRGSVAASCYPIPRELSSATFCGDKTLHHWGPGDKHRHDGSMNRTPSSRTNVEAPPPRKISDVHQRYEPTAVRQPSSSFHHDSTNDPLQRTLTTYSSKQIPHLLWDPEDRQHLTDLHCFVRKYCIYIFSATHEDVESKWIDRSFSISLELTLITRFAHDTQIHEKAGRRR